MVAIARTDVDAALREIRSQVSPHRVVVDLGILASYSQDQAAWAPVGSPVALVRAGSTSDVQAVVRSCYEHRLPVVPRGAGTGLSGGANAVDGCILLSLEGMDQILEINSVERYAVVQPGVVNDDLRTAVAAHQLWYPPDPASSPWSTLGGNIATNAGGVCCVKYGVTRDYVLQLEVVSGTGEVITLGTRTAKGVVGYDLVRLMVGSEGTLGIVTEATLKLRPIPPPAVTVSGHFASLTDAGAAAHQLAMAGVTPSALELVDRHCLRAVDAWKNMGLAVDANAVLLARVDEPPASVDLVADQIVQSFRAAGATFAARSTDTEEADALFAARRLAYPALERLGPVLTEDVCVPRDAVPTALEAIEDIARRYDVEIANIAHIGDGNLHPLIITPPEDDAARLRAQQAFEEILTVAIDLGGTVTGEHGVGLLKKNGMGRELSPAVLEMQHAVKQALDPRNILNPGKAIAG